LNVVEAQISPGAHVLFASDWARSRPSVGVTVPACDAIGAKVIAERSIGISNIRSCVLLAALRCSF